MRNVKSAVAAVSNAGLNDKNSRKSTRGGSEAQIAKAMLGKIGSPKSGLDPLFGEIFFRFDGLRRQKTVFQTIKWAGMDAAMACSAFAVS